MEIADVEIDEFTYRLEDVAQSGGHQTYSPGAVAEPPGFILTVRTKDGLEGHYRGFSFVEPMIVGVESAAPDFLIGRDPLEREGIWQDLWTALRHTDRLGMGAIDIALWDLAGKHYGESVSALLGGHRDRLPAYASTYFVDDEPDGLNGPEAFADFAEECAEEGYPGFKLHGHLGGDPEGDVEICRAVAGAVGDRMDLMLDVASEYDTYAEAVRVGRALDDLDFFWYEDPLADAGESIETMKRLRSAIETPMLGLEHVRSGPFGRADHLVSGAADLVRANANLDGGITGAMKIAHAAEALGGDVELHVGGPAHIHCMSAIRNTNYFEHALLHPQDIEWMSMQGFEDDIEEVEDGHVRVPDGPGLGVEVDWEFVEERRTGHTLIDGSG